MPRYQITLENDQKYEVETDTEIPDTPAGHALLRKLLGQELGQAEKGTASQPPPPEKWSWIDKAGERLFGKLPFQYSVEIEGGRRLVVDLPFELPSGPQGEQLLAKAVQDKLAEMERPKRLATQAVGGARDWAQGLVNQPFQLADAVLAFLHPVAPHPDRPRQPYTVSAPALPAVTPPVTLGEKGVRYGTTGALDILSLLALPYEPGRVVNKPHAGFPATPTVAAPAGPLAQPLSEGAMNVSRLLGLPDSVEAIAQMSQSQAAQARGVLQRAAAGDPGLLTDASTPLGQLYLAIEQRLLSFR